MRNIKLVLQYVGTRYNGWQIQPNGLSIQATLQAALREILGEETILIGAGRTDSGVHALAQVAHFRTVHPIELSILHRALNAKCPDDISVISVEEVDEKFDAQRSARSKTYSYFIFHSPYRLPLLAPFTLLRHGNLDLDKMHLCLEMLIGEHDFASFKAADSTAKTSTRKILSAGIKRIDLPEMNGTFSRFFGLSGIIPSPLAGGPHRTPPVRERWGGAPKGGPSIIAIHIIGEGFLKHMVRNIVGTLLDVGREKIGVEEFRRIFDSKDRTQAGMTAPAKGLFLVKVDY